MNYYFWLSYLGVFNTVTCIVLRDFSKEKNIIPELTAENLNAPSTAWNTKPAFKMMEFVKVDHIQDFTHHELGDELQKNNVPFTTEGGLPKEQAFHSKEIEKNSLDAEVLGNPSSEDDGAFLVSSDPSPTIGFEFFIESEAQKKANVIEQLSNSVVSFEEGSDEFEWENAINSIMVTSPDDCEEIQASTFIDSQSENNSASLISDQNLTVDSDVIAFGLTQDSENVVVFIPEDISENIHLNDTSTGSSLIETTDLREDLISELKNIHSEINQTEIQDSILSTSTSKVSNEELAENLWTETILLHNFTVLDNIQVKNITNETLIFDENNLNGKLNSTESTKKECPAAGFCLFSFVFMDTCSSHSDCRGGRLCCKSGCSKKCLLL